MLKVIILFVFVTTALGGYDANNPFHWWDTVRFNEKEFSSIKIMVFFFLSRMTIKSFQMNQLRLSHFQNVCYPVQDRNIYNRQICKTYLIKPFRMKNDLLKMNIMKITKRIMVR